MNRKTEYKKLRIVYMGTPEFAVAPLKRLIGDGCKVLAVVTAADKAAGRGKRITQSAVKRYALEKGIPVLQPTKLKDPDFIRELSGLKADLQVVVAFRMLPEAVWRLPSLGTFNLHASLLPEYRGAAPIHRALMNGEKRTGVTTFMIDEKIDTGHILLQEALDIGPDEDAGSLHDRLMETGAALVLKTVRQLATGEIRPIPQPGSESGRPLQQAPKIHKEDCKIDWERPVHELHNFIRGLAPYPGAYTSLSLPGSDPVIFKIYQSKAEKAAGRDSERAAPGTIITDGRKQMKVAAGDGCIHVLALQQQGKRRMNTEAFLNGFKHVDGARFS
ncbi:MAG: methionyl-tRNA formyltransferase [Bacteroidetes bacterium]|nr:MAG: methionyl-tRNA formyltransferase [Bacteroidota bacterium]